MLNSISSLLLLLAFVSAVPLNINLGAYSPALVVGDGEISFGGKQDVTSLMAALEGAAVSAAANNAVNGNTNVASTLPATVAAATVPSADAGTAAIIPTDTIAAVVPAKQSANIPDLQTASLPSMQSGVGLGNDIEPRVPGATDLVTKTVSIERRDITGFDRALSFAIAAMRLSPGVQLGTGAEGSGVGIKVDPGKDNVATAARQRRSVLEKRNMAEKKKRTRVTTMFIRGAGMAESVATPIEKRDVSESRDIDSVNLNLVSDKEMTVRFVEEDDEDDDEGDE